MSSNFHSIEDVIWSDLFPKIDIALRKGYHISSHEDDLYEFLLDAQDILEPFYRRLGAELIWKSDRYFYLLPRGDKLSRSTLSTGEMLVGQVLALLYLDPSTLEFRGEVSYDLVLQRLSGFFSGKKLLAILEGRQRKYNERTGEEEIRKSIRRALRSLRKMGFITRVEQGHYQLHSSLMRFVEPVRGAAEQEKALRNLIQKGEIEHSSLEAEEEK